MLAPVSEAEFGDAGAQMLALTLRSAASWPAFAEDLERVAGEQVGLLRRGTLMVAQDTDAARELERQIAHRDSLDLRARRVLPSEARELEPALAPAIRLALELPDDHSVDPRRVLCALQKACAATGVHVREHASVTGLAADADGLQGVELAGGELVRCSAVVLAAGAWSAELAVAAGARLPVRPVKGQLLRLRDPAGPGLLRRNVRFEGGYLVPRVDGRYVLGATVEERGFDEAPTAGAVYQLLRDAHEVVPGVSELELEQVCVGLRPGTPDNLPIVGPGETSGLFFATGHYRNGVLLAPLTAELLVDALGGAGADALLAACSPARFQAAAGDLRTGEAVAAR
jgi:glycine oxidase